MHTNIPQDGDLEPLQTDPPATEPLQLRPLTKRRTQGARAGELYTRTPEIEADIRSALALSPTALVKRIAQINYPEIEDLNNPPEKFLRPEALVYLFRHYGMRSREMFDKRQYREAKVYSDTMMAIGDAIDHFVARGIRKRLQGLRGQSRQRAEDQVRDRMMQLLHDSSQKGAGLEVCLGSVILGRCLNAIEKHEIAADSTRMSDYASDQAEPHYEKDQLPSPDSSAQVNSILKLLPREQREAFVRRELDGASYDTLEEELGVSRRTISERKKNAKATLRKILNNDDDRPDPGA